MEMDITVAHPGVQYHPELFTAIGVAFTYPMCLLLICLHYLIGIFARI